MFTKLLIDGKNEGLHGILVRIRDNNMNVMPGVTVEDMGHKMGLNGVDNAKLSFDQVKLWVFKVNVIWGLILIRIALYLFLF